jgi:hypothetical protein
MGFLRADGRERLAKEYKKIHRELLDLISRIERVQSEEQPYYTDSPASKKTKEVLQEVKENVMRAEKTLKTAPYVSL